MNEPLVFDVDTHTYWCGGVRVPGVTNVLEPYYDWTGVDPVALAIAADRGSMVHEATALDDHLDLDEDSLDERLVGYVHAWRRFREESGFRPLVVEHKVFHRAHWFAGTLDRVGVFRNNPTRWLIDIKTGVPQPATSLQTAAYALALASQSPEFSADLRGAAYLRGDGTYRLVRYDDPCDATDWLAALRIHNWRNANGR